jgi:hypothetical protein
VRVGPHFNPAFLRYLGEMLLFVLAIALGLEMLAVSQRKARDLAGKSRGRTLLLWAIPLALAVGLLVWLLFHRHHS